MVSGPKSGAAQGMTVKQEDPCEAELPFVDAVPEDLQCGICFGPCLEPHVTEECGHLFCKSCVSTALEVKTECPICRVTVTLEQVRKDVRTQRKIAGLNVYCKYRKTGGCQWQGVLSDLERHTEKCEHALVPCPYTAHGCDATVTRHSLADHMQTAMSSHMVLAASALTRLQEEQLTLQQEIEILQRHDQRFIWVIPNFMCRKAPAYSRKFTAKSHQWYLGVDFDVCRYPKSGLLVNDESGD